MSKYYFDSGSIYSIENRRFLDENEICDRLEKLDKIREILHGEDGREIILGIAELLGEDLTV